MFSVAMLPILSEGGKPSWNPLAFDPGTTALSFIVFLVVVFILSKYAWKPLLASIESREKRIAEALAAAEKARVDAENLRKDFDAQMKAARLEAEKAIQEGRVSAEKFAQEIQGKAREEADRLRERAKEEIDLARRQAIDDIRREAVDLALKAASVVVRKSLDDREHRRIASEVVAEVGAGEVA
jgi:F-type H+-transporting ATPase subunit b